MPNHQDTPYSDQAHQDVPGRSQPHSDTPPQHADYHADSHLPTHNDFTGGHVDDAGSHQDTPAVSSPHADVSHQDAPHQDAAIAGHSPLTNQAAMGPIAFGLSNHQAHGHGGHVIYLVGEADKSKNDLYVAVQNISGSAITFQTTDTLTLLMGDVLPADVIENMHVAAIGGGWQIRQHQVHRRVKGYDLQPSSTFSWANQQTLTFHLTNIHFTTSEISSLSGQQGDFVLSFSNPSPGEDRAKVFLLPWHQEPKMLRHFEAAFCPIPRSAGWNIRVDETDIWLPDKDEDVVFSNAIADMEIRSRLAFRLTNKDLKDPLTLDTNSSFKISFLEGEYGGELATGQNLVNDLSISELNTNDWEFTQAASEDAPVWTLTPKQTLILEPHGGTYEFLIDSVFTNGVPGSNERGADFTEMYIQYSNIPAREGGGHYDDDYLAATIEKVAPASHFIAHFLEGKTLALQGPGIPSRLPLSGQDGVTFHMYLTISQVTLVLRQDGSATLNFLVTDGSDTSDPRLVHWPGSWFLSSENASSHKLAVHCMAEKDLSIFIDQLNFKELWLGIDINIDSQGDLSLVTGSNTYAWFHGTEAIQSEIRPTTTRLKMANRDELWSFA